MTLLHLALSLSCARSLSLSLSLHLFWGVIWQSFVGLFSENGDWALWSLISTLHLWVPWARSGQHWGPCHLPGRGRGGGGHNEGWTQGNGGSAGEQRGAAPEPFLLHGQGVKKVEVVGGDGERAIRERVRGKRRRRGGRSLNGTWGTSLVTSEECVGIAILV